MSTKALRSESAQPSRNSREGIRNAVRTLATLVAMLVASCASSPRLVATWSEPGHTPKPYRDVLVFGVAPNEKVRRAFEDGFVAALKARGLRAKAGHSLMPAGGLGDLGWVKKAVALSGSDAVVVTYLAGERVAPNAPAGHARAPQPLHSSLFTYYGRIYQTVTEPGYYADRNVLLLETNLYDTARGRLVWAGRTQPMDPSSEETTINEVIETMTAAMANSGFLPAR